MTRSVRRRRLTSGSYGARDQVQLSLASSSQRVQADCSNLMGGFHARKESIICIILCFFNSVIVFHLRCPLDQGFPGETGEIHQGAGHHPHRQAAGGEERNYQTLNQTYPSFTESINNKHL